MAEPRIYECIVCLRNAPEPLAMKPCAICEQPCCVNCLPDHETRCAKDLQALQDLEALSRQ